MLTTALLLWTLATTAVATEVPCSFGSPASPRPVPTAPARILVELRLTPETSTKAISDTLEPLLAAELPVVVLVPPSWTPDDPAFRFPSRGVDIGILGTVSDLVGEPVADPSAMFTADWRTALKTSRRAVTRATQMRPKVLAMPPPDLTGEVSIDEAGFQVFLPIDPGSSAPLRRARAYGGRTGRTRIVTEGIPSDACGALLGTPVQSALDRVTRIGPGLVVTRVALSPEPDTARALALWWKSTALPAEWKAWSAAMVYVRAGAPPLAPKPAEATLPPGATISTAALTEASAAIVAARRLPRVLPGDLNLTEALVGLMAWAAEPGHEGYTVPKVGPPPDEARSTLAGPTPLSATELRDAAEQLLPALQSSVPSLVNVGSHTLTTGEFLVALAHLHRQEPAVARAVPSPDPYAPGGGWGTVR